MSQYEYKCVKPNIFAVQYNGDNDDEIIEFCEGKATIEEIDLTKHKSNTLYIETNQGQLICNKNDFVVKNFNDEFYPIGPLTFASSYQII